MDTAKLILDQPALQPRQLKNLSKIDGFSEEKKKQAAKDFESILLGRLLNEMKNTVGDWGFEKDGASRQVQGIFWLYLARDIANNGGFGLWKDIYKSVTNSDQTKTTTKLPERQV